MADGTIDANDPPPPIREARGVGSLLLEGLLKINALSGGGIAIIATILVGLVLPGEKIPVWAAMIIGGLIAWFAFVFLVAVVASVKDARELRSIAVQERERYKQELEARRSEQAKRAQPVVVAAVRAYSPYRNARCVLIVDWPSGSALPMGARVIISTQLSTHEQPLGEGLVRPSQQDGKSVVTLDTAHDDTEQYLKHLLDQSTSEDAVKKIRIGPGYDLQNIQPPLSGSISPVVAPPPASGDPVKP